MKTFDIYRLYQPPQVQLSPIKDLEYSYCMIYEKEKFFRYSRFSKSSYALYSGRPTKHQDLHQQQSGEQCGRWGVVRELALLRAEPGVQPVHQEAEHQHQDLWRQQQLGYIRGRHSSWIRSFPAGNNLPWRMWLIFAFYIHWRTCGGLDRSAWLHLI